MRRRFYELAKAGPAPIASEALTRIAELDRFEGEICGRSLDECWAGRQIRSRSVVEAIRYALGRWAGLSRFLDDGRVGIDNNVVERAIRLIALTRKNALFAVSDGKAGHWAVVTSLVQTCKLNGVEPRTYLIDVSARIVAGQPQSGPNDLLPWTYASQPLKAVT